MTDIEIIGKLRALGMNREADALMQVYLTLSSVLVERNKLAKGIDLFLASVDEDLNDKAAWEALRLLREEPDHD